MAVAETRYEHIILDEKKTPVIAGTTMKVVELVLDSTAYGWSPEELHFQHPQLTLGQIYSALAYYWDHREELDKDIEQRLRFVEQLRRARKPTPLEQRLGYPVKPGQRRVRSTHHMPTCLWCVKRTLPNS